MSPLAVFFVISLGLFILGNLFVIWFMASAASLNKRCQAAEEQALLNWANEKSQALLKAGLLESPK